MIALTMTGSVALFLFGAAALAIGTAEIDRWQVAIILAGTFLITLSCTGFLLSGVAIGMRP